MDSNEFYLSDNEERNINDDEAIPSTSTSTSNLKSIKKRKARRPEKSLADKPVKVHQQTIQQPIHLVEVDDFKLLLKGFDSRFKMPCTSNTVSLKLDIWSSRAHNSYLGITCHWLTDLFELHEIVFEIGELDDHCATDIVESIFSITTDNGANVKFAIQQMGITNIKCAGHTLQLSINLGLKQVDELISKYKALVSILSKKKKRKQLCEAQLQIALGLKELLDVIKDVDTRWNSIFYFIKHLVHLRPAIMQLYSTLNNHTLREVRRGAETMSSYLPSEEEFELLKELIEILSLFDNTTEFLSGSKYPTLGFITPMLEELARRLRYFTGQNNEAIFVKDTILNNLIESQFNELNSTDNNTVPTNNNNTSHQHKKLKMVSFFSYLRTENVISNKFDYYYELPEVSLDEESSSSVPSEQLFSDASNHITNKHTRLDPDLLKQL
ncbi:46543_t:CDS:2, partial [Gigaspora margarita]